MSATTRGQAVGLPQQGMIAPSEAFVQIDGTLQPVAFRFLWGLYQEVAKLQAAATTLQDEVTTLQNRLTAAGL